jgi:two-component system sensor histidine kinase RegB
MAPEMPPDYADHSDQLLSPSNLRLDTLVRLRWLAIAGQTGALLFVHYALAFPLPLVPALGVIALSALLNVALRLRFPVSRRIGVGAAGLLLGYDVLQLALLLYLTGGLQNPFAVLFLAPVLISATALPPRMTLLLGLLAVGCASLLAFYHRPLPWTGAPPSLPFLYVAGVWTALTLALAFIGTYAFRVAKEARQLAEALAATELVLAREQHLSALDGLAAAAAHELGTPLATIALVAKELDRALPLDDPHREDLELLLQQTGRCRDILRTLSTLDEGGAPHERMPLSVLVEETVAPSRSFGVAIETRQAGYGPEPVGNRNPGILYGIGNLIENAVDFARERVLVTTRWDDAEVEVEVSDDGPGFSPEIRARLGEPYVSSRGGPQRSGAEPEAGGLGLGFFIAKTLLERTGAKVAIANAPPPSSGAVVRVLWPRAAFENVGAERR